MLTSFVSFCLLFVLFCSYVTNGETIARSPYTQDDKHRIVSLHNKFRSKIALGKQEDPKFPMASNMNRLVWDEGLALTAQDWTDHCIFDHRNKSNGQKELVFIEKYMDKSAITVPANNFGFGENLWATAAKEVGTVEFTLDAAQGWFNEISEMDGAGYDGRSGHYTLEIQGKARYVGCGVTNCPNGLKEANDFYSMVVCHYYPPTNSKDGTPYNKAETIPVCSECPDDLKTCVNGLCSASGVTAEPTAYPTASPTTPSPTVNTDLIDLENCPNRWANCEDEYKGQCADSKVACDCPVMCGLKSTSHCQDIDKTCQIQKWKDTCKTNKQMRCNCPVTCYDVLKW